MTVGATLPMAYQMEPGLSIYSSATAHILIDVIGYFEPPIHAEILPQGGFVSRSERVLSAERVGPGRYKVTVDGFLVGCTVIATTRGAWHVVAVIPISEPDRIEAYTWSPDGGANDMHWYLKVVC